MKNELKFSHGLIIGLVIFIGVFIVGLMAGQFNEYFPLQDKSKSQVIINQLKELKRFEVLQADIFAYKTYESGALLSFNNNQFVVVETGKAIYGLDLARDFTVNITNKDIELNLPDIEIFDLIVNPDSVDFIGVKKSLFSSQQDFENLKKEVSIELFRELKLKSNNKEIISQARRNAELIIYSMLRALGYEKIVINFGNNKVRVE